MRAGGSTKIFYDNDEVGSYINNISFISSRNTAIVLCWVDIVASVINIGLAFPQNSFSYFFTGALALPMAIIGLMGAIRIERCLSISYGLIAGGFLSVGFAYTLLVMFFGANKSSGSFIYGSPYLVHMIAGLYSLSLAGKMEESSGSSSYSRFQSFGRISWARDEEAVREPLISSPVRESNTSARATTVSNASAASAALMRAQTGGSGQKCRSCNTEKCEYAFSPCGHPALCRSCVGFAETYLESIGKKCPQCSKESGRLQRIWS